MLNEMQSTSDIAQPSADEIIARCMEPSKPRSFFLYAGAGSGKTRSLVNALENFRTHHGRHLGIRGRKIGVITYTNAARDEIERRVGFDTLFHISTIHSFAWSMIRGFHSDIREWLKVEIAAELVKLKAQQAKGRDGSQAAQDRERKIRTETARLSNLDSIVAFTYDPRGDNYGRDSLSHAEVIQMTSAFLQRKLLMQSLLINRYPYLLIDESQDTNADLIDSLFVVERAHRGKFALGLFGDMMQRIYPDGKHDLGRVLPEDWERPAKLINHRSAKRIVLLGNALRRDVDAQQQQSPDDKPDGHVRLFIAPAGEGEKKDIERAAREKMADITADGGWLKPDSVTVLALEHHMAASRLGFAEMWQALYGCKYLKRGLIDGDLSGVRLFSERVMPVADAGARGDRFTIAELLKQYSPLLRRGQLAVADDQRSHLATARTAVNGLITLIADNDQVTFLEVLRYVAEHDLFEVPGPLRPFIDRDSFECVDSDDQEETDALQAWRRFLEVRFAQIIPYTRYVADMGDFNTHHGVKGLEFKRVMVLLDDTEARGFTYSYDKLLGVTPPTATDLKKEHEGKDTGIARTRRLMYVTCTRAEDALAVLVYSSDPVKIQEHVIRHNWLTSSEVVIIGQ